jgi:nucleoid-associated protein EbfC
VLKGLEGLGNLAGMGNLMKQVQDMQAKLTEIEDELVDLTVEGAAGGGMVTVVANGKQDIQSVTIDPELLTPDELDLLQDMVMAATNQALEQSRQLRADKLSALTGGMKLPGLM